MKITVMFLTYAAKENSKRTEYAKTCLKSLLDNLEFSDGELAYHIADDGSAFGHLQVLKNMVVQHGPKVSWSNSGHLGYGGNYNVATQYIHGSTDLVLAIEDDWELIRKFDLTDLAHALMEFKEYPDNERVECIRLGYIGWTNGLKGKLVKCDHQTFLRFDEDSSEVHVFAGHPRLETVEFEKRLGPWPEGMNAGYTEIAVSNMPNSRKYVGWPLDAGVNASQNYVSLFGHVGEEQA